MDKIIKIMQNLKGVGLRDSSLVLYLVNNSVSGV